MAPQAVAAEAAEPHLEPERHCNVARCHQRRRRRHEQRGHHGDHEPNGLHPAAHPLRPTLPRRRHLPRFPTPAVSGARTSRRTVPTNFRRSPAAEATRRRRACVAGEPRASGAGLGSRARAKGFEPPGRRNSLTGEEKRVGSTANNGSGGGETRREEGRGAEREWGGYLWNSGL